jgi:hypothetical protein
MSSQLQNMAGQATVNAVGAAGSVAITGTGAVTPPSGYYIFAIQPITDTVVASQVNVSGATNATLSALSTIATGLTVYGKWSSITLTSGSAIGYISRL